MNLKRSWKSDESIQVIETHASFNSNINRPLSECLLFGTDPGDSLYLYDGWNRAAEYLGTYGNPGSWGAATLYVWGSDLSGTLQGAGGVGGLLAVELRSTPSAPSLQGYYYPCYDGNGNITEYVDTVGQVVARFDYGPFGELVHTPTSHSPFLDYRFSTKPCDAETGYYYYGYRYYDPLTGRWPSRDPIEEEGGENLYGFVYNDPLNYFDNLGNAPQSAQNAQRVARNQANQQNRANNQNAAATNRIAQNANRGAAALDEAASTPGNAASGLTELANLASNKLRMKLLEKNYNQAYDKCYDKAKLIFTKGTGSKSGTTCDVCCQVSLHVSWEGVAESHVLKIFYGHCDDNQKDRTDWLNQPSLSSPGFDANFEHPFNYSQFR